ncbi:MAG TPA: serine/threonine-protein kinase, partial [Kofleriaceae bacterium]|nr:serine/threonine-protein kinase [Kofleriaceae bacterium]
MGGPFQPEEESGLAPGTLVGRYVVLAGIGAGAAGLVYAAQDSSLGRKVALKLVRDPRRSRARVRFLREAQALAKLSHPNVIAVYDVGEYQRQVYLAIQLVEGTTLREWLAAERRGWREVVEVMLAAAEGLSAAHAAGIVHRDFKPENVLIDREGRVRVGDFGLALIERDTGPAGVDEEVRERRLVESEDDEAPPVIGSPAGGITETGAAVGTPAYMAPEQHAAEPVGAKADQFAFCVTLYEALHGERPFDGETAAELSDAIAAGRMRETPPGSDVPAWLRRAVVRGLAPRPGDRHASMEALAAALRSRLRGRRRLGLAAAAAITGAAVAAGALLLGGEPPPCQDARERLAGVWDAGRKQEVRAAFLATRSPVAGAAWAGVERALDAHAAEWARIHTGSCEATHVSGEQSETVLDLEMECLARRRAEMRALVGVFRRADGKTVEAAVRAASGLAPLAECANQALLRNELPPADDQVKAKAEALRQRLADVNALVMTGKYKEAMAGARAAAGDARALGFRPTEAEALFALGRIQRFNGDLTGAEESLYDAIAAAEAGRSATIEREAWLELTWLVGVAAARFDEGERLVRLARGALDHDDSLATEARFEGLAGVLSSARGRPDQARPHLERAIALTEKTAGREALSMIEPLHNLAIVAQLEGKADESLELHRRALALVARHLGADHPESLSLLSNQAAVLEGVGRADEALATYHRALALMEKLGLVDTESGSALIHNLGGAQYDAGDKAAAAASFERALAVQERVYRGPHPFQIASHQALAEVLSDM